jgi:hypothetical protein
MAKAEKQNTPQPIAPKIIDKGNHLDNTTQVPIPAGKVFVMQVDKDGKEIEGKGFLISEKQFEKTYKKNPKFQIKKKAGQ